MDKFSRLLYIINTLRYKRGMRAREIADDCNVSLRTIYRDLSSLSSAGVPIYYENGYKILNGGFLPPLNFEEEEAFYIICALSNNVVPDGSYNKEIRKSILAKLRGSLSESIGTLDTPEAIAIYARVTAKPNIKGEIFETIREGINNNCETEIEYDSLNSGVSGRIVDPYSVVFRGHSWYLIAYCHTRNELRTFRLSRIIKAKGTERRFRRKDNYSIKDYFKDSWELYKGKLVEFSAEFRGKASKVILSGIHHPSESIKLESGGRVIYSAKASGREEIIRWLIGFGEDVKILSPPDLIEDVKKHLQSTLNVYRDPS